MLLFLVCNQFMAQDACNYSLSGHVIDEHDSSKLAFASIFLIEESRGTTADVKGYFVLNKLCAKSYTLVISHLGCESDTIALRIRGNLRRNFYLEHHLEELNEVVVSKSRSNQGMNQKEISEQELFENSGKALGEILSSINGVNTYKTGANISKPVINGFKNNRVQIINQGIALNSQQWGNEHAPEIDPFSAAKYTVVKGASAVKYAGGVLGGLVIIEPKALPRKPRFGGAVSGIYASNNRMYNSSVMLEGNSKVLPAVSWRVQGSFKRSGNIKTPNYYQKNTGVKELNGSADIGYYKENWNIRFFYSQFNSEIGIFSGAHIGNLSDLQRAISSEGPRTEDQEGFSYEIRRPKQKIIHELAKVDINYYLKKGGSINVKLARQFNIREEFDKELPRNSYLASLNIPEFSVNLESYSSLINWSLPNIGNWQSSIGLSAQQQDNKLNSFTDFIPDFTNHSFSGYLLEEWSKNEFELALGFRVDQNQFEVNKLVNREFQKFKRQFTALTFNLGAQYNWKKQTIKTNFTYTERPPAINELFSSGLHHGTASIESGMADLRKEKSSSVDFTFQVNGKSVFYELYSYIRYVEDFIFLNPNGLELSIRGAFPSFGWTNTNALVRGIDQSFQLKLGEKIKLNNEVSFIWGDNVSDNNYLINMPSNTIRNAFSYTIKSKNQKRELSAHAGNQIVLEQSRFNAEQEIASPPEGYSIYFAGIGLKKIMRENHSLQISVKADNLFDTVYRDYLNQFRFYTDEQGRNITFRINYNF